MNYSNDQKREIEHLASNTPGLKDYGTKGRENDGSPKEGFFTLKDNRTIKLIDLTDTSTNPDDTIQDGINMEEAAKSFPELQSYVGIGWDKQLQKAKKGFYKVKADGRVISIKQLREAMTKKASEKNINTD